MCELKTFSLIIATYGRDRELDCFLNSILNIDYSLEKIEVIIVDQNKKLNLAPIINKYRSTLNIKYIKSNIMGLSKNRNIGIAEATGEIIAFPDDDCEYLKETLITVNNILLKNNCDLIMGKIIKRDGTDSLRKWDSNECVVTKGNFYKKSSSITMFIRNSSMDVKLNERLGVGEKFGACEDADLIYRACKNKLKVIYTPDVKVYHPHYDSRVNMCNEKVYKYGLGFGAMVRQNLDFNMMILFVKAEIYHIVKALIYLLKFNLELSKKSLLAFKSRMEGLRMYRKYN